MTGEREWGRLETDPVRLACVLAVVTAVGAMEYPPFAGLSLVLVGLAVGAYLVSYRRRHPGQNRPSPRTFVAFAALGGAAALAVGLPYPGAWASALVLAVGALPLWWDARGVARRPRGAP